MAYTKKTWVSGETPLSAENMNNIENGIANAHEDISELNTKMIKKDGSNVSVNPVNNLNIFYNGIGLFNGSVSNVPTDDWWAVIAFGFDGTTYQRAFNFWNGTQKFRNSTSSGSWSDWLDI